METKRVVEMGEEVTPQHMEEEDEEESDDDEEQKLLSRYGVWLLVELCPPNKEVPVVSSQFKNSTSNKDKLHNTRVFYLTYF
jgi:hypothetical protein